MVECESLYSGEYLDPMMMGLCEAEQAKCPAFQTPRPEESHEETAQESHRADVGFKF